MSQSVPASRTQIYLKPHQRQRLDEIADTRKVSFAAIIREAVDRYIESAPVDPTSALDSTFGAAPAAAAPDRGDWLPRDARQHGGE